MLYPSESFELLIAQKGYCHGALAHFCAAPELRAVGASLPCELEEGCIAHRWQGLEQEFEVGGQKTTSIIFWKCHYCVNRCSG